MHKQKPSSAQPRTEADATTARLRRAVKTASSQESSRKSSGSDGAMREIVESIVIAFVLAFLFRTFEAEAFVIPTGSMAPTLMGRHKDVVCEKCGFAYQISASEEVDAESGSPRVPPVHVIAGTCPNCRYTMYLGPDNPQSKTYPSYKGDRILVGKFPYDLGEPARWDVAVFKYPGGAQTNFIKRLVGLPEETLKISRGDILVKPKGSEEFGIARKPPAKIEAMLQPVYDNSYVVPEIIQQGWPARWNSIPARDPGAAWQPSDDLRSFHTGGSAEQEAWLRYRHYAPSFEDWRYLLSGGIIDPSTVRPHLITDFTAYNTGIDASSPYLAPAGHGIGLHWVGDLVVEAVVDVESTSGELVFELVEGGRQFQCRIDVATGVARLSIDGLDGYHPQGETEIDKPGGYHVRFANVDDQLLVWVNKSLVEFDQDTAYPRLDNGVPTARDLEPAGIGSRGAALRVSQLNLRRDLYYIAAQGNSITDFGHSGPPYLPMSPDRVAGFLQFLSDPSQWDAFRNFNEVEFTLEKDQFLMLGDNSAASKDSRLWDREEFYVRRDLLIGKALYIYWPHSFNRVPGAGIWFPFFPNFARMGFVR